MIVEDNRILLDDFIAKFNWESNGYRIIATATSGNQGIQKCRKLRPDILITDIKMPGIDGLEMLKVLDNEGIMPHTFLLSSYDEFSYAKQGFNLGVIDYLLKNEITSELLANKLCKAKKRVLAEQKNSAAILQNDLKHLTTTNYVVNDQFKNKLFKYLMICATPPLPVKSMPPKTINMMPMIDSINRNPIFEDAFKAIELIHPNVILAIIDEQQFLNFETLSALCETSECHFSKYYQLQYTKEIFIYDKQLSLEDFKKLLEKTILALPSIFFLNNNKSHNLSDLHMKSQKNNSICLTHILSEVNSAINLKDNIALSSTIETAYNGIINDSDYDSLIDLTNELINIILELKRHIPENFAAQLPNEFCFYRAKDIPGRLISCFEQLLDISNTIYSPIVTHAIHYIYSHYQENSISAANIAEAVNVSTNYLHKLFRDETGETINSFITDLRIKQSIGLIERTNLRTSEIAEEVGFISSKYYAKLFLKHTGLSVSEYRKRIVL